MQRKNGVINEEGVLSPNKKNLEYKSHKGHHKE